MRTSNSKYDDDDDVDDDDDHVDVDEGEEMTVCKKHTNNIEMMKHPASKLAARWKFLGLVFLSQMYAHIFISVFSILSRLLSHNTFCVSVRVCVQKMCGWVLCIPHSILAQY